MAGLFKAGQCFATLSNLDMQLCPKIFCNFVQKGLAKNSKYIPAIYSGNKEVDNKANAELYLRLVLEGDEKGFCPVLVDKEIMHYVYAPKYGFSDAKEDYCKITKRLIDLASYDCFSVWYGRLLYNYYLDGNRDEEGVKYDLDLLTPPSDKKYIDKSPRFLPILMAKIYYFMLRYNKLGF